MYDSKIIKLWFWKVFNLAKAGADPDDNEWYWWNGFSVIKNNLDEISADFDKRTLNTSDVCFNRAKYQHIPFKLLPDSLLKKTYFQKKNKIPLYSQTINEHILVKSAMETLEILLKIILFHNGENNASMKKHFWETTVPESKGFHFSVF